MSTTCRTAVVGAAGYWGSYYTKAFAANPDCELFAIADTAAMRRAEFAQTYGIPSTYNTVDDLLRDSVPDICSISLPVSVSYDAVLACAEAGVPVITCEKPISENLAKADEMVDICAKRGSILSCGTAMWEYPLFPDMIDWVQGGNIGEQERVSIPGGLSSYVTGNGCVQLVAARRLCGSEVAWVEGWTEPEEAAYSDEDCNAYGSIGFVNGAACEVPSASNAPPRTGCVGVSGTLGQAWIARQGPVCMSRENGSSDTNTELHPVYPPFFRRFSGGFLDNFSRVTNTFVELYRRSLQDDMPGIRDVVMTGSTAYSSGHDYRQALEIAIALKLSARNNHERVELPLRDRSHILNPVPYRLLGGDVTGWDAIGLKPPKIRE